jgi:hypothetical protein
MLDPWDENPVSRARHAVALVSRAGSIDWSRSATRC